jgi:hypothetical protein
MLMRRTNKRKKLHQRLGMGMANLKMRSTNLRAGIYCSGIRRYRTFIQIAFGTFAVVMSSALHGSTPASQSENRPAFALKEGEGVTVCEAYLRRLNRSQFSAPPYCDRPENTDVRNFTRLNRVLLNTDEILKLDRQIFGFLMHNDVAYWEKYAAERRRLGLAVTSDAQLRREIELQVKQNREVQRHFRFDPPVDADNDGKPDSVVIWRDTGFVCGEVYRGNSPARSSTYALVLDSNGNVDASRTQKIFGHPSGGYVVSYKDREGNAITRETDRFRPIGTSIGVVVYASKTYFDTFYSVWGDIKNERRTDPEITNTLALLKHEDGKTAAVCEFVWKEAK